MKVHYPFAFIASNIMNEGKKCIPYRRLLYLLSIKKLIQCYLKVKKDPKSHLSHIKILFNEWMKLD